MLAWILLTLGHVPGRGWVLTGRGARLDLLLPALHSTRQLSNPRSATKPTNNAGRLDFSSPFCSCVPSSPALLLLTDYPPSNVICRPRGAATAARKSEHHRQKAAAAHSATPPIHSSRTPGRPTPTFPLHHIPHHTRSQPPCPAPAQKFRPASPQTQPQQSDSLDFPAITVPFLSPQVARHG